MPFSPGENAAQSKPRTDYGERLERKNVTLPPSLVAAVAETGVPLSRAIREALELWLAGR